MLWFRKGLRLHDNPALHAACRGASHVYPVFVLDPWFLRPDPSAPSPGSTRVGINRIRFLLESLADLDASLRARGSRLLLLQGDPATVVPRLCQRWGVTRLCFEFDTEPYAQTRDGAVQEAARRDGVEVVCPVSHTIFDPRETIQRNKGKPPMTYQSFIKLLGTPHAPAPAPPSKLPPLGPEVNSSPGPSAQSQPSAKENTASETGAQLHILPGVPSLSDLGYTRAAEGQEEGAGEEEEEPPFRGGETEGLRRLGEMMQRRQWVADFEKPKGDPSAFMAPATTVLSPYLKFGCVSARLMYARVKEVYALQRKHTLPPVSLEGQLLWREFFYTAAYGTPNFDRMEGNAACRQVAWTRDPEMLRRWRDGQTGFPWIDAIMMQLRKWGWMHHLARHSVACFLTRGDLYVHWEEGRDVFDRLLLDADWAINNGNWLWLSASAFFSQYHRIYSPISFGKKYDPTGKFIRKFVPVLKGQPRVPLLVSTGKHLRNAGACDGELSRGDSGLPSSSSACGRCFRLPILAAQYGSFGR